MHLALRTPFADHGDTLDPCPAEKQVQGKSCDQPRTVEPSRTGDEHSAALANGYRYLVSRIQSDLKLLAGEGLVVVVVVWSMDYMYAREVV